MNIWPISWNEGWGRGCVKPRQLLSYIAFTMPSVIFFASPRSIMVLSR